MSEPLRLRQTVISLKDIELTLRIRRSPAETFVLEIKEGEASICVERNTVKDVPFATKRKGRKKS